MAAAIVFPIYVLLTMYLRRQGFGWPRSILLAIFWPVAILVVLCRRTEQAVTAREAAQHNGVR